jgi:hypothetical protein
MTPRQTDNSFCGEMQYEIARLLYPTSTLLVAVYRRSERDKLLYMENYLLGIHEFSFFHLFCSLD